MPIFNFMQIISGKLPIIGTVRASNDKGGRMYPFVSFRILKHPLAQEFSSLIPWLFTDYFQQNAYLYEELSLSAVITKIESLQKLNSIILRRVAIENIVNDLKQISLQNFSNYDWNFLQECKDKIFALPQSTLGFMQLPAMYTAKNAVSVVFWLQLLEFVVALQSVSIFWTMGNTFSLPFLSIYLTPLEPSMVTAFLPGNNQQATVANQNLGFFPDLSLFALLQKWSSIKCD
jgi:hypothetical protein